MIRRRLASAIAAALVAVTGRLGAASERPLVVLVRPAVESRAVSEALIRVNGELVEGGFDVAVVDALPDAEPREAIEQAGRSLAPAVTVGLFGDSSASLELWIADRLTGKTVIRRLDAPREPDGQASEVLAIRTAELLRASLMELLMHSRTRPERADGGAAPNLPAPAAALPAISHWAAAGLAPTAGASRVGFELGVSALGSFEGLAPAVVPVVRGRAALSSRVHLRLTAAGLGTRPTVQGSGGTASVRQDLLLFEVGYRPAPTAALRPQLTLGAGAYHVGVEGHTSWPYEGIANDRWSMAFDAGAGCALPLHAFVEAAIEAHAVLAPNYPTVRLLNDVPAAAGRPTWMVVLTLAGWL